MQAEDRDVREGGNILEQLSPASASFTHGAATGDLRGRAQALPQPLYVTRVAAVSLTDPDSVFLSRPLLSLQELVKADAENQEDEEARPARTRTATTAASLPANPHRFGIAVSCPSQIGTTERSVNGPSAFFHKVEMEEHVSPSVNVKTAEEKDRETYASAPVVSIKYKTRRWRRQPAPPRHITPEAVPRNAAPGANEHTSPGGREAAASLGSLAPTSSPRLLVVPVDEAHLLVSYHGLSPSAVPPGETGGAMAERVRHVLDVQNGSPTDGRTPPASGVLLLSDPLLGRSCATPSACRQALPFAAFSGFARDYTPFNMRHNRHVMERVWAEKRRRYEVTLHAAASSGTTEASAAHAGNATVLINVTDSGGDTTVGEASATPADQRGGSPPAARPLFSDAAGTSTTAVAKPSVATVSSTTASSESADASPPTTSQEEPTTRAGSTHHKAQHQQQHQQEEVVNRESIEDINRTQQRILWEEEIALEQAYAHKWSHRFLVTDEDNHAIWALQVHLDRDDANQDAGTVRVVPPSEFFDVVTEESLQAHSPSPRSTRRPSPGSGRMNPHEDSATAFSPEKDNAEEFIGGDLHLGSKGPGRSRSRSAASASAEAAELVPVPLLGGKKGFMDGHFSIARFNRPTALCWRLDSEGEDDGDHTWRPTGTTTPARRRGGDASPLPKPYWDRSIHPQGSNGDTDTPPALGSLASLHVTCSVLFISDSGNHAIRYANFQNRIVRTVAGLDGVPGYRDGSCVSSLLREATAMAWCSTGLVFTDGPNAAVRVITGIGKQTPPHPRQPSQGGTPPASSGNTPNASPIQPAATRTPGPEVKTTLQDALAATEARTDALLDELFAGDPTATEPLSEVPTTEAKEPETVTPQKSQKPLHPQPPAADASPREESTVTDTNTPTATRGQPRVWTVAGAQHTKRHTSARTATSGGGRGGGDVAKVAQESPIKESNSSCSSYVDCVAANRAFIGYPADLAIVSDGTLGSAKVLFLDRDSHAVRCIDGQGVTTLVGPWDYTEGNTGVTTSSSLSTSLTVGMPPGLVLPTQLTACSLVKERAPLLFHGSDDPSTQGTDKEGASAAPAHIASPDGYLHSSSLLLLVASATTGCVSVLQPVAEATMEQLAQEYESEQGQEAPRKDASNKDSISAAWGERVLSLMRLGLASEGRRTLGEAGLPSLRRLVLPFPSVTDNDAAAAAPDSHESGQCSEDAAALIAEQYLRLHFPWVLPPPLPQTASCLANLYCYVSGRRQGTAASPREGQRSSFLPTDTPSPRSTHFTYPLFETPTRVRAAATRAESTTMASPCDAVPATREGTADTETDDYLLVDVSPQTTVRKGSRRRASEGDRAMPALSEDASPMDRQPGTDLMEERFSRSGDANGNAERRFSGDGSCGGQQEREESPGEPPLLFPPERTLLDHGGEGHMPPSDPPAPAEGERRRLFPDPATAMAAKGAGNPAGLSRAQLPSYHAQFDALPESARQQRTVTAQLNPGCEEDRGSEVQEATGRSSARTVFVEVGADGADEGRSHPGQAAGAQPSAHGAARRSQSRSGGPPQPLTPRALSAHRLMQPRGSVTGSAPSSSRRRALSVPPTMPSVTSTGKGARQGVLTTTNAHSQHQQQRQGSAPTDAADVLNASTASATSAQMLRQKAAAYDDAVAKLFAVYEAFAQRTVERKPVVAPATAPSTSSRGPPPIVGVETVATYSMTYLSLMRFLYHTGYLDLPTRLAAATVQSTSSTAPAWPLTCTDEDHLFLPHSPADWRAVSAVLHACGLKTRGYHVLANMNFAAFRRLVLLLSLWEAQVRAFMDRSRIELAEDAEAETQRQATGLTRQKASTGDSDALALRYGLLDRVPALDALSEEVVVEAYRTAYTRTLERVPGFLAKQQKREERSPARRHGQGPPSQRESGAGAETAAAGSQTSRQRRNGSRSTHSSPSSSPDLSPIQASSPTNGPPSVQADLAAKVAPSPTSPSPSTSSRRCSPPPTRVCVTPAAVAVDSLLRLLARNEPTLRQLFDAYSRPVRVRRSANYQAPTSAAVTELAVLNASQASSAPPCIGREESHTRVYADGTVAPARRRGGAHGSTLASIGRLAPRTYDAVAPADLRYYSRITPAPTKGARALKGGGSGMGSGDRGPIPSLHSPPAVQAAALRDAWSRASEAAAPQDVSWKLKQLFTISANENTQTRQTVVEQVPVMGYASFQSLFKAVDVFPGLLSQVMLQEAFVDALREPLLPLNGPRAAEPAARAAAATPAEGKDERAATLAVLEAICEARRRRHAHAAAPFGLSNEGEEESEVARLPEANTRAPAVQRNEAAAAASTTRRHTAAQRGPGRTSPASTLEETVLRDGGALTFPAFVDAFVRVGMTAFSLAGAADDVRYPAAVDKVHALCLWINKQVLMGLVAEREASGQRVGVGPKGNGSTGSTQRVVGSGGTRLATPSHTRAVFPPAFKLFVLPSAKASAPPSEAFPGRH